MAKVYLQNTIFSAIVGETIVEEKLKVEKGTTQFPLQEKDQPLVAKFDDFFKGDIS